MVPGTGIEPVPLSGANFKSATSTNFVIRARPRSLAHWRTLRIRQAIQGQARSGKKSGGNGNFAMRAREPLGSCADLPQ